MTYGKKTFAININQGKMHVQNTTGEYWFYGSGGEEQSTSKVLHEVLQLHLPLRLDVGAVHVCVEEDDGKCQDEDSVWVPELPHHTGVADAVALAARRESNTESEHSCSPSRLEEAVKFPLGSTYGQRYQC